MHEPLSSWSKTIAVCFGGLVVAFILAVVAPKSEAVLGVAPLSSALVAAAWSAVAILLIVTLSGVLVIYRAVSRSRGREDLFLALNRARSEPVLRIAAHPRRKSVPGMTLRRLMSRMPLLVGDAVRIKPLNEILATLDEGGSLEGLPFMPEMAKFCGTTARVFRVIDKIYDYGGRKNFRRIENTVLLTDLRCNGAEHDGCQARCYLLWKSAWLDKISDPHGVIERERGQRPEEEHILGSNPALQKVRASTRQSDSSGEVRYRCQFTELVSASRPLSPADPRQDIRPLLHGNLTLAAFGVAILTRLFNRVQTIRAGVGYPWRPRHAPGSSVPEKLGLDPGELVRVRTPAEIASTLSLAGRNRGLWFDSDMLKHTERVYRVLCRVERIIDDASGRMITMKHPCIVLDGVYGSGEWMRFCAQHDYVFWREAWLQRMDHTYPRSTAREPDDAITTCGT